MYLTFGEVILVQDKTKLRESDPVVYVREYQGQRILTTDNEPSAFATEAVPYGHLYFEMKDTCVIPDTWDWADAALAKEAIFNVDHLS